MPWSTSLLIPRTQPGARQWSSHALTLRGGAGSARISSTLLIILAPLAIAIGFLVAVGGDDDDSAWASIGYGRAFDRYAIIAVFAFFVLPVILDYVWPLWDAKNQVLHDKVVGSVVKA